MTLSITVMSFMLSLASKSFIISVIKLNVFMMNTVKLCCDAIWAEVAVAAAIFVVAVVAEAAAAAAMSVVAAVAVSAAIVFAVTSLYVGAVIVAATTIAAAPGKAAATVGTDVFVATVKAD